MNFTGLQTSFGKPRPQGGIEAAPAIHAGDPKALARRSDEKKLAFLHEADDVLAALPGPGEQLHALMTGRYDLTDLIGRLLARIGKPVEMLVATLSYSERNLTHLLEWLDSGKVLSFAMVCSKFFHDHNKEFSQQAREELTKRGARIAHPRSHAKVICIHVPATGAKIVMEGSANLRTNSNQEQLCILNCPKLHDWHALWITELLTKHESDQSPIA
jgi:hypothetical protein